MLFKLYQNLNEIFVISCFILFCLYLYRKWREFNYYGFLPTYRLPLSLLFRNLIFGIASGESSFTRIFFQCITGLSEVFRDDGLFVLWILWRPTVFIHKAEIVKKIILHPDSQRKSKEYDLFKLFFGSGLNTSEGEMWSKHRKVANQAFRKGVLKDQIIIFNKHAEKIVAKFRDLAKEPWTEASHLLSSCVLNVASDVIMGMETEGGERDKDVRTYLETLEELKLTAVYVLSRPWLCLKCCVYFPFMRKALQKISDITAINEKIIEEKIVQYSLEKQNPETNGSSGKLKISLMDILLRHHLRGNNYSLQEVKDEVNAFLLSGFDTTAISIKWLLYLVGLHPQVQWNIFCELKSILGSDREKKPTFSDLNDMKYLECVIKETLRLFPALPIISRTVQEDIQIGNFILPKGATVAINIFMLHRDSAQYSRPEQFSPERFLPENCKNRHPYAFLPFSGGDRNCIGQNFAMLEIKVILCHIFRNFEITSLDCRDKMNVSWEVTLNNAEPFRLEIKPRDM